MLDVMVQRTLYYSILTCDVRIKFRTYSARVGGILRMRIRSHLPRPPLARAGLKPVPGELEIERPEHQYFLGSYFYAMFFIQWEVSYQCWDGVGVCVRVALMLVYVLHTCTYIIYILLYGFILGAIISSYDGKPS